MEQESYLLNTSNDLGGKNMYIFKEIIGIVIRTIGSFVLGTGISQLHNGNYKIASLLLLGVSILFMVGYFAERWSK